MDWDAIGAIADLASALAVAVSLVYVAVQVRELRRQAQIQLDFHFQETADRSRVEVWTNPEVAEFLERCATSSAPLSPADRRRFGAHIAQRLWSWSHIYRFRESDEGWRQMSPGILEFLRGKAALEIWEVQRSRLPIDFAREVDRVLAATDS